MILAGVLVAWVGAIVSVPLRRHLGAVSSLSVVTLAAVIVLGSALDYRADGAVADLALRVSPLVPVLEPVLVGELLLITLYVALVEPVYNYYPVALFTAAAVQGVLVLNAALPLFLVLLAALSAPVVAFTFRIHRTRSLEAALRHFGSVAIGGMLGVAALALAALQPLSAGEERLAVTVLLVLVIAAFAVLLGAFPFHGHLAILTTESPVSSLAVLFGVLTPLTFVAFLLLLAQSGVLPAVASIAKAQTLLSSLGVASAFGGALFAIGAPDLRRLVAYSVVSNVGVGLVGLSTFSSSGLIGAVGTLVVTGVAATQQLLAAGTLAQASLPDDSGPSARRAPLAAASFVAGSLALVGLPPLAGFPPRFLVEQIAFAVSMPVGAAIVAAALGLLVAHLRAGLQLFAEAPEVWRLEPRPVAGAGGLVVLGLLVIGGLYPDLYLRSIAEFAGEFMATLRPF